MASNNNPYGLPPPPMHMVNNAGVINANVNPQLQQYHQQQNLQQQHQSERISGDGEEVGRYGYFRPTPVGPPTQLVPPSLGGPPLQVPPTANNNTVGYNNYESFNQVPLNSNQNPYEQYDPYGPNGMHQMQQHQQNGILEQTEYPASENRSIEGEEQHLQRFGNDPNGYSLQGVGAMVPPMPPMPSSATVGYTQPTPPTASLTSTASVPLMESYEPVGVEMPQQYQAISQQEQRSETIGSAASNVLQPSVIPAVHEGDFRSGDGEYPSLDHQSDNDPRSIEGQEHRDPEGSLPGGNPNPSFLSSNPSSTSLSSIPVPPKQEHRSQTIGSESQQVDDNPRSIEGQEQIPIDSAIGIGSGGLNGPPHHTLTTSSASAPTQSSHQRSETLGSDTFHDEPRGTLKSKKSGAKPHKPTSGSETGESGGKSTRDIDDRRRRDDDSDTNRRATKGRRGEGRDRDRKSRNRFPSFEDDDSYDEDDKRRYDSRREQGWEKEGKKSRPRDTKDRNIKESRGGDDWDSRSTRDYRQYSRNYGNDGDDYRPPSRNSSYHESRDDYYRPRTRHNRSGRPQEDYYRDPYSRGRGPPPYGYPDLATSMLGVPSRSQFGSMGYPEAYPTAAAVSSVNPQKAQQLYLEKLRYDNPEVYREWYAKYQYYVHNKATARMPPIPGFPTPTLGGTLNSQRSAGPASVLASDRPRATSGRSSVTDEVLGLNSQGQNDVGFRPIDKPREPSPPKRMTPQKFLTSHSIGMLTPLGHLVRVRNGGTVVEILNIKPLMKKAPEYKEVKNFPGPLIKSVTHKNTLIQFCQRKIRELEFNDAQLDRDNLILLWELLILLLQQNGSPVGSDIAELLLKSKSAGKVTDALVDRESSDDELTKDNEVDSPAQSKDEAQCIEKFCEKLLYGHQKEALDYAMDNGLWGHALFFASKMKEKTYGNVLARFANEMAINSPLQTLYQVLSGKQPASVTCCCDEAFGDWKPHLAMILSNAGQRPDVEGQAITMLGDTLANRKHKFAAQFCYLMADVELSAESRLGALLGFIPSANNVLEATQMTEIYEFARTLGNPEFSLGTSFIQSKLDYTKTLIDLGFVQDAYAYCEELTKSLRKGRIYDRERSLAWSILQIAERLVNCDDSADSKEPAWIEELRKIADQIESQTTSRKQSLATSVSDQNTDVQSSNQYNQYPSEPYQSLPSQNAISLDTPSHEALPQPTTNYGESGLQNQNQWSQPEVHSTYDSTSLQYGVINNQPQPVSDPYGVIPNNVMPNGPTDFAHDKGLQDNNNYLPTYPAPTYPITPYGTGAPSQDQNLNDVNNAYSKTEDTQLRQRHPSKPAEQSQRPTEKPKKGDLLGGEKQSKGSSWFPTFSIFSKLKPKNQMILPDDKDPTIVWDEATKKWLNTKDGEEEDSGPKGPPPRDSDLMGMGNKPSTLQPPIMQNIPTNNHHMGPVTQGSGSLPNPNHSSAYPSQSPGMNGAVGGNLMPPAPTANAVNKYKRPKGLSLRNNYVDLLNPNGQRTSSQDPVSQAPLGAVPPNSGPGMPNIFMPPPVPVSSDEAPMSFLTTSSEPLTNSNEGNDQAPPAPQMFDPSQFQNMNNYGLNR